MEYQMRLRLGQKFPFYKLITAILLFVTTQKPLSAQPMPWAHGRTPAGQLSVYLVTFGPGDDLTTWFGHAGLVIRDSVAHLSKIYNFGLFAFDEGFIKNFIFGRLIFWKGRSDLAPMLTYYKNEHRTIRFYRLNLEDSAKVVLARQLEEEVRPGNRKYLYDHYRDNCATRLRDLIDNALHGQFKEQTRLMTPDTYRTLTMQYTDAHPLWQWLLLFLMNDTIDAPLSRWQTMFLPDYLARYVTQATYTDSHGVNRPLTNRHWTEYDAGRQPPPSADKLDTHPVWPLLSGLFYMLLMYLLSGTARRHAVGRRALAFSLFFFPFLAGIIGSVLFFMAFFTNHTVTWHNENLLLWHPLTLLSALPALATYSPKNGTRPWKQLELFWLVQSLLVLILLIAKIFPPFSQDNLMALSFGVPFVWAHYLAVKRFQTK
ncbi:MAG: DUF4105 domain-containing protein [Calditrichaeota bacterium]|nr:MAG: DUF4105 domain-containing protein [Calditrichota bacterium]